MHRDRQCCPSDLSQAQGSHAAELHAAWSVQAGQCDKPDHLENAQLKSISAAHAILLSTAQAGLPGLCVQAFAGGDAMLHRRRPSAALVQAPGATSAHAALSTHTPAPAAASLHRCTPGGRTSGGGWRSVAAAISAEPGRPERSPVCALQHSIGCECCLLQPPAPGKSLRIQDHRLG